MTAELYSFPKKEGRTPPPQKNILEQSKLYHSLEPYERSIFFPNISRLLHNTRTTVLAIALAVGLSGDMGKKSQVGEKPQPSLRHDIPWQAALLEKIIDTSPFARSGDDEYYRTRDPDILIVRNTVDHSLSEVRRIGGKFITVQREQE